MEDIRSVSDWSNLQLLQPPMHIIHSHQVLTLPISLHSSSFSSSSLHIMRGFNDSWAEIQKEPSESYEPKGPIQHFFQHRWNKYINSWSCGSNLLFSACFINIFYWWSALQQILTTKELASSSSSGSSHSSSSTASRALQCVDLSECNEYFARWIWQTLRRSCI